VSAAWKVPNLAPTTLGFASTWIGADTSSGPDGFIQIGVNEERLIPAGDAGLPTVAYRAFWWAFWSDAAHGFRPVWLGPVQPGDLVHASLRWVHGRWSLRLVDPNSLLTVQFSINDEFGHPPDLGEWLQEDVAANITTGRLFPYPRLSRIEFRELRVNTAPPRTRDLVAVRMSPTKKLTLGPSQLRGDAFTISPVR
jgi:hypothetical protein